MDKIFLFSFLACICFLYSLNLYLRGAKRHTIEVVLALLLVATVIVSLFVMESWWRLIALISPFVFVGVFRPLAQDLAYRILGYRTDVDDPSESLDDMIRQMASGEEGFKQALEKASQRAENRSKQLSALDRKNRA